MILIVFILKKPLMLRFYLMLAVGRTTWLLQLLTRMLTDKKEDQKVEEQIEWLHSQKVREVKIRSRDGLQLKGYFLEHPETERIILMFHGWRGSWDKDCAAFAHGLYEKKCSVLMICQRAHDGSGGKYIGFGVLERNDCQEWIRYLDVHTEKLPIYLSGVSMGASTVLMAAGEELPDRVKGVIADCGFTSPYEMVKIFAMKFMHMEGEQLDHIVEDVNRLCRKKAGYDFKEYNTIEAMQNCSLPVFFAHGTGDHFVPCEMTMENYQACFGEKTLYTVEGAAHNKSYISEPHKYMEAVSSFFQWEPV